MESDGIGLLRWSLVVAGAVALACCENGDGQAGPDAISDGTTGQTLTVALSGSGNGAVSSQPAGIACPPECAAQFVTTSEVTLTAQPASGYELLGWAGACAGDGECQVVMDGEREVQATFGRSSVAWATSAGGPGTWMRPWGLDVAPDGTIWVGGAYWGGQVTIGRTVLDPSPYSPDFQVPFLARFSSTGEAEWATNFPDHPGFGAGAVVEDLAVSSSGGVVATGGGAHGPDTPAECSGWSTGWVAKFEPTGALEWAHASCGSGEGWARPRQLAVDPSGDIVVTGEFQGIASVAGVLLEDPVHDVDIFLLRFSEKGALLASRTLGGSGYDFPRHLAIHDETGDLLLSGDADCPADFGGGDRLPPDPMQTDVFLARYDVNLEHVWSSCLGGGGTDMSGLGALPGGDAVVALGIALPVYLDGIPSAQHGDDDIVLARMAVDGQPTWAFTKGSGTAEAPTSIAVGEDVVMVGMTNSPIDLGGGTIGEGTIGDDVSSGFAVRYSAEGVHSWSRLLGGGQDGASAPMIVSLAPDSSPIVAGTFGGGHLTLGDTTLISVGYGDLFLVKLPP